ncbi:MAG: glycosyltransferase family 9 protein [Elusimicrobia bacterium]|nr:glycosyltransferase family 9 protein [Elusimicrobiota bacterium]
MNLDKVRGIDLWVGRPLCFILTLFRMLSDLLRRPSAERPVRRILLVKLSEMGAIVLAYPLISYLKKRYPQARLSFLTFSKNVPAFRLLNDTIVSEEIFTIEEDSLSSLGISSFRAIRAIRRRGVDVVIDLEFFSRFTQCLSFLSGAWMRAGLYHYHFEGLYRGELLTHKVQYNPLVHCSVSYLSLGKALVDPRKDVPEFADNIVCEDLVFPAFVSTDAGRQRVLDKLKGLGVEGGDWILMNPGEGVLMMREWPLEKFIELARRILSVEGRTILVVGSNPVTGKDKALCAAIGSPRCVNIVGQTTMEELLELASLSKLVISNDCGLPHMTALTSCPKVVLFGPESPVVFSPVGKKTHIVCSNFPCSPCLSVFNHRKTSCVENNCLKSIPVAPVHALVESVLAGTARDEWRIHGRS